jgi:transcriptional regulator with XRE-family HTH domain
MDHLIKVGEKIRQARIKANLTQDDLAKMVGYTSRSSINKIEKGLVDLPRSKLIKISNALGVTPSYLMGWDDEPKKEYPPIPDGLTEDERFWVEIYRKVSPEIQDLLITMVSSFDQQSEDARQMLLRLLRAALGNPS